ncbi:ABC transporter permease [Phocoenobacter atlanticus]|uniref:ABC transporter permease n=1 Tax=Phocoenobacter atlanticus TaxID=3416742 RepID=UPI002777C108|nr:ABC transporter permease [Pasteurella atlantica]MDP8100995.1 ABC transporter permease [Pasteurella atlantica]
MNTFIAAIRDTFKSIFTDAGVLLLLIIAPIIYGLYYPLPYSTEIVRNVPVAIVDNAHDSLSRKMIRMITATPTVTAKVVSDERQAKELLLEDKIMALMVIPENLQRNVILGKPATVNMIGNGNYVLASKYAQQSMASAVLTLSAGVEIKKLLPFAKSYQKVTAIRDPVPLQIQPLYNQTEGYGSYVVPAVAWLILQQTLLIACAMLVSTWYENHKAYASATQWLGRLTTISVIHYVICLGYTGSMFSFWGYPSGANPIGNLFLIALFSPCVATLGCLLGLLIKDRERTMQILVFSALPMYFMSGFSWPADLLPIPLQYLRWIFPSTSVIQAGVSLNQLGGTVLDNLHYFIALGIITWLGLAMLFWFGKKE